MNKKIRNSDKKRNIKLIMEYDGSGYAGWQRLGTDTRKPTIQSVLEECLSSCLEEDIKVIGSGRTDAGVHAFGQTANFYCSCLLHPGEIKASVNLFLPEDIKVLHMEEADRNFHSRYSARSKTYEYRITQGDVQSVFTRKYSFLVSEPLNTAAMEKGAGYLLGTHDFKAFSSDRKDGKSTVRTINEIKIDTFPGRYQKNYGSEIRVTITGDGFLYNMVRIITGTLIEIGKGRRRPEDIPIILKSKVREEAGPTVTSQGLFLVKVNYE